MGKKSGRGTGNREEIISQERFFKGHQQMATEYSKSHIPSFQNQILFSVGAIGSLITKSKLTGKSKVKEFVCLFILNKKMFVSMYF